jgi:hypothetical protein
MAELIPYNSPVPVLPFINSTPGGILKFSEFSIQYLSVNYVSNLTTVPVLARVLANRLIIDTLCCMASVHERASNIVPVTHYTVASGKYT